MTARYATSRTRDNDCSSALLVAGRALDAWLGDLSNPHDWPHREARAVGCLARAGTDVGLLLLERSERFPSRAALLCATLGTDRNDVLEEHARAGDADAITALAASGREAVPVLIYVLTRFGPDSLAHAAAEDALQELGMNRRDAVRESVRVAHRLCHDEREALLDAVAGEVVP